jgi:seryl-tRNA synthetase
MLDVNDFIVERGGNPEEIRESQRRRFAKTEVVDEVISLYEDHRKSKCRPSHGHGALSANEVQTRVQRTTPLPRSIVRSTKYRSKLGRRRRLVGPPCHRQTETLRCRE